MLGMPDPIPVNDAVIVPSDALEMRAVRSSGPGGQNVNKVASKVILLVDLERIQGLDSESRERLARLSLKRLDRDGRLQVSSQRSRNQQENLKDAREKVRELIAQALEPEKERHATRPGPASRARRLDEKSRHSRRKKERQRHRGMTNDD
jgi:ribosome-associated protein